MADEAVEDFRSSLTDLTFNSKPLINMLTMLAEENILYAEQIVKVIEDHIQKAAMSHKLPALYLVDSIIKNVSNSNYLALFTRNIVATFVFVFEKVDEKTRQSMFKLRQTWNDLFPSQKLYTLDVRVNHIDPAWPISAQPKTGTSIHVNPKFLLKQSSSPDIDTTPAPLVQKELTKETHVSSTSRQKKLQAVVESASSASEDAEEQLIRDMMAKKQELLKLEQQKLELQLAEARASLERLAAQQAAQHMESGIQHKTREVLTTFLTIPAPSLRDPRVKADFSVPGVTGTSQQTAVILPSRTSSSDVTSAAPPGSSLSLLRPESIVSLSKSNESVTAPPVQVVSSRVSPELSTNSTLPASVHSTTTNLGGMMSSNIFDRILDLVPTPATRSDRSTVPAPFVPGSSSVEKLNPVSKDPIADIVTSSKTLPAQPLSEGTLPPRSIGGAKEAPKEDQSLDKKTAGDQGDSQPLLAGRRRTAEQNKSTSPNKKDESGPVAKKMKHSKENDVTVKTTQLTAASYSLPNDLKELFGEKDQDYRDLRCLPPIPKLDQARRQPLLDPPVPGMIAAQSALRASFKADHPDDFHSKRATRANPADELNTHDNFPGAVSGKQALLPTPEQSRDAEDGVLSNSKKPKVLLDNDSPDEIWLRGKDMPIYNPSSLHPAIRRPIIPDSNSRSPLRQHENQDNRSPRYDDHHPAVSVPMKNSLLGDMPRFLEKTQIGGFNGADNPPKGFPPLVNRSEVKWQNSSPARKPDLELWDAPVKPTFDENRFYVAEYDVRWCVRAQVGDRSTEMYSVNINDRQFEMAVNSLRRIQINNSTIEVVLDSRLRQLIINGVSCYRFGCPPKKVTLKGNIFKVFVRGPEVKLWIDEHLFEINVDSPPERIIIGGKEHSIAIDGAGDRIIVDGFDVCPFGTEEEQMVQLAFVLHKITFKPPQKQILIDGKLCSVDLSGKFPVIWINNQPRGIRFDGEPREIFIDDKPWLVPMNGARKCRIDGPKPRLLAFGGPGHEVIIDDQWFEVKFGGEAKIVKFGGRTHKIQLRGKPPEVKILAEVIGARDLLHLIDDQSPGFSDRKPVNRKEVDGRALKPPPVPVPALLDLPTLAPHSSLSQHDPRFPNMNSQTDQFPGPAEDPRSAMLKRNSSEPSLTITQSGHQMDRHPSFDNRQFAPSNGYTQDPRSTHDNRMMHDMRPVQFQPMPANNPLPLTTMGPMQMPGIAVEPFHNGRPMVPSSVSQQPQTPVGGMVDVNLLLTQLLAKGLIGMATSAEPVPAPSTSDVQPDARDQEQKQSPVAESATKLEVPQKPSSTSSKVPVFEEQKEIARKEEQSIEAIPSILDFELEKLRKRYAGAIQHLYVGVSCSSCGLRFKSDTVDQYQDHLDWHFRQNRHEKEGVKIAKFRQWYYEVVDWVQFEEVADIEEKAQSAFFESALESATSSTNALPESLAKIPDVVVCPEASESEKGDICEMCRETFEQFWNEDREAWHLKDAISVKGKIYHPVCFEDSAKEGRQCGDTSTIYGDQSMVDFNDSADEDGTQMESVDSTEVTIPAIEHSPVRQKDEENLSSVGPASPDAAIEVKPVVLGFHQSVLVPPSSPNCVPDGSDNKSDNYVMVKSEVVDCVAQSRVVEERVEIDDVVIKDEIGEIEYFPTAPVKNIPLEMEIESVKTESRDFAPEGHQVKAEIPDEAVVEPTKMDSS